MHLILDVAATWTVIATSNLVRSNWQRRDAEGNANKEYYAAAPR